VVVTALAIADFIFHFFCCALFSSSSFPIFTWFIIGQRQPDEGWRGKERAASRGL